MQERKYEYFKDRQEERSSRKIFVIFAIILLVFFAVAFPVNIYVERNYENITINGLSMQPTINPYPVLVEYNVNGNIERKYVQDWVYMKKNEPVTYGDIVIIDKKDSLGKTIIKRLLGMGGDRITILKMNIDGNEEYRFLRIKSGTSTIEVVNEDYICGQCRSTAGVVRTLSYQTWTENMVATYNLGNYYEGQFYSIFLSGNSITDENLFVKDLFVYQGVEYYNVKFYKLDEGKIFYMGDNRAESSDARYTGSENETKIRGKVVSIMRNATSAKNSIFYYFSRIGGYFDIIWQEIIKIFAWKG